MSKLKGLIRCQIDLRPLDFTKEARLYPHTAYRRLGAKGSYLTLVRVADRIL